MWELLTRPENIAFSVSLMIMLMLGILEIINLVIGGLSDWLDQFLPESLIESPTDIGVDGAGAFISFLAWLYVGRVPVLMWLVVFLAVFGVTGLVLQNIWFGFFNQYLSAWLASIVVLILCLPLVRITALGLSKILPKDETTAIHSDALVGLAAEIIVGDARQGYAAQAKLKDQFGQTHYVMVEPDLDETLLQGSEILLVSKDGTTFKAILKNRI